MSPKKLTEDDKKEILDLYRQTPETTSTLAEKFGVSSSTISRFLKLCLSENEYEVLIQQKRLARVSKSDSQLSLALEDSKNAIALDLPDQPLGISSEDFPPIPPLEIIDVIKSSASEEIQIPSVTDATPIQVKTRKRRSTATTQLPTEIIPEITLVDPIIPVMIENIPEIISFDPIIPVTEDLPIIEEIPEKKISKKITLKSELTTAISQSNNQPAIASNSPLMPISLDANDLGELVKELGKLPKIAPDLEDLEDDLDDDLDDEEEDDWDEDEETSFVLSLNNSDNLIVLPLSAAKFPTTCYLVIDRTAELIVRPLKEFAHLGKIPPEEVQQKTLPIFDNHRVARRFSNRTQRVIKVPDSSVLRKTSAHLKAKGITRIFLDGQVYSLAN